MLRLTSALLFVAMIASVMMMMFVTADDKLSVNPPDMACINWKAWNSNEQTPNPSELFVVSTDAWVMQYNNQECSVRGDIIPCWSTDAGHSNTFGHHDYQPNYIPNDFCRIYENRTGFGPDVYKSNNFLLPFRGPKYDTYKKVLTQTGAKVPDDAIRVGNRVMAISTTRAKGACAGVGFSGWAEVVEQDDGTEVFGAVHFSIVDSPFTTETFQIAVCKAYTNPPQSTTTVLPPPTTTYKPNSKPYIRFAHTVPTQHTVSATITQGSISKSWANYSFGQFSGWNQLFSVGDGQVTIRDAESGKTLITQTIYLSPGPLVVAIKGYWPLNQYSIEGIAASYVPPTSGMSGVRLVNLAPDVVSAGLDGNGKKLVDGVKFTTSSIWAPVSSEESISFTAQDDQTGKTLTTAKFQAPASPMVFTNFLIGLSNASASSNLGPQMVSLLDAPEM